MTIKSFVDSFRNCPMCSGKLTLNVESRYPTEEKTKFTAEMKNDRMTIKVNSSNFIDSNRTTSQFSILYQDGRIVGCENANAYVSLYELDLLITKHCPRCWSENKQFSISMNLSYDTTMSSFKSEMWEEVFAHQFGDEYYYFANEYHNHKSYIYINTYVSRNRFAPDLVRYVKTPFIPFEKFEFDNKERLFSKLNSIRLLA